MSQFPGFEQFDLQHVGEFLSKFMKPTFEVFNPEERIQEFDGRIRSAELRRLWGT
jgi:hypothetical protein